ncbi:MAG: L-2-amino-thiazoline-4-carboxylic acid hydrolase, partial [Anaerolineaceae bacterium]
KTATAVQPDGSIRPIATFCPIAAAFIEMGSRAVSLGRLYCYVDQAKYHAYNPALEFAHTQNVLDGDAYCEFLVTEKA